jgi:hypothetical protein
MAISINYPATDSSSLISPSITIPALTWGSDWAVAQQRNEGSNSVLLQNLSAGLLTPQSFMVSKRELQNVYANTTVDRALWAPTTKGQRLTIGFKDSPYLTDSADASWLQVLPVLAELRVSVPYSQYVTASVVEYVISRMIAGLHETGQTTMTTRLTRLLRGALTPSDL